MCDRLKLSRKVAIKSNCLDDDLKTRHPFLIEKISAVRKRNRFNLIKEQAEIVSHN